MVCDAHPAASGFSGGAVMRMRITSGLLAWGIRPLLLAGPSLAYTADGTSALGGLTLIHRRRPYN